MHIRREAMQHRRRGTTLMTTTMPGNTLSLVLALLLPLLVLQIFSFSSQTVVATKLRSQLHQQYPLRMNNPDDDIINNNYNFNGVSITIPSFDTSSDANYVIRFANSQNGLDQGSCTSRHKTLRSCSCVELLTYSNRRE